MTIESETGLLSSYRGSWEPHFAPVIPADSYGKLELKPTEAIIGAQFSRGTGGASRNEVIVMTRDQSTGLLRGYRADWSPGIQSVVPAETYGRLALTPTEIIVGTQFSRGTGGASHDEVIVITRDQSTGLLRGYRAGWSPQIESVVPPETFGRVELAQNETILNAQFSFRSGGASHNEVIVMTRDQSTGLLRGYRADWSPGIQSVVPPETFGRVDLAQNETILNAQFSFRSGGASANEVILMTRDRNAGLLRGYRGSWEPHFASDVPAQTYGKLVPQRSCESVFANL